MRKTSLASCCGWLFLALLCCVGTVRGEKPGADASDDGAPLKLDVIIDTCFSPTFEVKSDGDGSLLYTVSSYSDPEKKYVVLSSVALKPTAAQWKEFRQALDDAKVWQWHEKYVSTNVLDGTGWELKAAYKGKEVKSGGGNCYPEADASPGAPARPTAPFNAVMAAVEKLAGGRVFNTTKDFSWYGDMFNVLMTPPTKVNFTDAKCVDGIDFFKKKGEESMALWSPDHKPGALKFVLQFDAKKQETRFDYNCANVSYCTALKGFLDQCGLE